MMRSALARALPPPQHYDTAPADDACETQQRTRITSCHCRSAPFVPVKLV